MVGGNKKTCESILLKSFKIIQKKSKKKYSDLINSTITNTTPLLKMNKRTSKKGKRKSAATEVPSVLINNKMRFSLAVQYIISNTKKNKIGISFERKLAKEILENSNSNAIEFKDNQQIQVILKKRFLISSMYSKLRKSN